MKDKRLVLVEWVDSMGCSTSWSDMSKIGEPKPLVCRSVGWLAYDGEVVVVVPHIAEVVDDDDQGCGDMMIPRVAIISITDLEPGKVNRLRKRKRK